MEKSPLTVCGMVMGEASESDDDYEYEEMGHRDEENNLEVKESRNPSPAPDLQSKPALPSRDVPKTPVRKPKYNSILHKKLRESNANLCHDLQNLTRTPYLNASVRLQSADQYLQRSCTTLQTVPQHLKTLNHSLVALQSRLESIANFKPLF